MFGVCVDPILCFDHGTFLGFGSLVARAAVFRVRFVEEDESCAAHYLRASSLFLNGDFEVRVFRVLKDVGTQRCFCSGSLTGSRFEEAVEAAQSPQALYA